MIPTDTSGKWVAYETVKELETRAILEMGSKLEVLEQKLASAYYRIQELEQQLYGSK